MWNKLTLSHAMSFLARRASKNVSMELPVARIAVASPLLVMIVESFVAKSSAAFCPTCWLDCKI